MKRVEFVVILDDGVRKRHIHEADKGIVHAFAVQLEVKSDNLWLPVIRYDSAHGFAHVDKYAPDGRKEKVLLDFDLNTALTLADWDINNNWERYVEDFWRKKR